MSFMYFLKLTLQLYIQILCIFFNFLLYCLIYYNYYITDIIYFLIKFLIDFNINHLIYTNIFDYVYIKIKITLIFAFFFTIPFIILNYILYISSNLYYKEYLNKKYFFYYIAYIIFNVYIYYFFFLKNINLIFLNENFLFNYQYNVHFEPKIDTYCAFIIKFFYYYFCIIHIPLIIYILLKFELLTIKHLIKYKNTFFLVNIIILLLLTPIEINGLFFFLFFMFFLFEFLFYLKLISLIKIKENF